MCVSNTGCEVPNEVKLYDSLFTGVTLTTKQQIAALLHVEDAECIDVKIMPVEQQTNSTDCGVYAIAFATSLCHGVDPSTIKFNRRAIRSHLWKCMEGGNSIEMFPGVISQGVPATSSKHVIQIYCTCRQPYSPGEDMAQCSSCEKWFHKKCVKIPQKIFKYKQCKWQCNSCAACN